MKKLLSPFIYFFTKCALAFRYRIEVSGLEQIQERGGIIFLSNHPAEIDPVILTNILWKKYRPHPLALDVFFQDSFLRWCLEFVGALPVPSFDTSSNSFKRKQIDRIFEKIHASIQNKENILIYPAGGLKTQGEEIIGGASGVHKVLQACPEAKIVLVRITGLWGSSFSKALTGKTPQLKSTFLNGAKVVLKNLFFFVPKRNVLVEFAEPPVGFPRHGNRLEFNRALEAWYNAKGAEPLTLVSYSRWKEEIPKPFVFAKEEQLLENSIPQDIEKKILEELSQLSKRQTIKRSDDLALDLGLDSLDQATLVIFLKEHFGVGGVQPADLKTVEDVLAFAAKIKKVKREETEEVKKPVHKWLTEENRHEPLPPFGTTIIEAFLHASKRLDGNLACADEMSGEVSYTKMRIAVLLLARQISKIPGERIGIMLPASVAVNAVILATHLAGKTPVMINWTLGPRNLRAILKDAQIANTISSWRFLDRLENFELDGFDEDIYLLEELRREFSLIDKLRALALSKMSPQAILDHFKFKKTENDDAVILYTSGTESLPKGVPLSHHNILSNQRDAFKSVTFTSGHTMLGALPPFHSFGFSVTGLFPLLTGLKVAYSPNPTDGRRMSQAIERWKATVLCLAPTFLKNIFRTGSQKQLESLQLVIAGAEKMPQEVYDKIKQIVPEATVTEGYGITECAPILTLNPPFGKKKGVGIPFASVELIVVDPETHVPLGKNREGLILAKGPNVFRGYLDPKLPSPFITVEGSQWYVTGDIGILDDENYLTLTGRLKRFVKIGGEMVSLGAIEEIFYQELGPFESDAPMLAVSAKEDEGKKTSLALFIAFPLTLEQGNLILKKHGMSNLVRLSNTFQLPFIPLLGTGKIDYRLLNTKW